MRAMYIQPNRLNWLHYFQEAIGLAMFMMSACFFSVTLKGNPAGIAIMMGLTALLIFYLPFTAASGSQINPAVTLAFLRIGRIAARDACFYILFQFAGGTFAVYIMRWLMGSSLIMPPINTVVTVPVNGSVFRALLVEFSISLVTMFVVLVTSQQKQLQSFSRPLAGLLVTIWVLVAGPVSGFGMNPARSFASAIASNTWNAFWIYLLAPVAGMLGAAEIYLSLLRKHIIQNKTS